MRGPLEGLAFFVAMQGVGFLGLTLSSFIVHRTEYAWSSGAESVTEETTDYAMWVWNDGGDDGKVDVFLASLT